MDHGCGVEFQLATTQRECIALLDNQRVVAKIDSIEELTEHLNGACRADDLHLRVTLQRLDDRSRMVGLHVVHNTVVGRATIEGPLHLLEPLVTHATIDGIHQGNLLVKD